MIAYVLLSLLDQLFPHNYFLYPGNIYWFFKMFPSHYVQYEKTTEKPHSHIWWTVLIISSTLLRISIMAPFFMDQRFSLSPYPVTEGLSDLELLRSRASGSTLSICLLIPKGFTALVLFYLSRFSFLWFCFCLSVYHFENKLNPFFDFYTPYQVFMSLIIWGEGPQKEPSSVALCLVLSSLSNRYALPCLL